MGTEVITYSRIGKEDIRFGKGTFEVVLADGRKVTLNEVDLGAIINDATVSSSAFPYWFNVQSYGGDSQVGVGGDDTAAFQSAINDAVAAGGGTVVVPMPSSAAYNVTALTCAPVSGQTHINFLGLGGVGANGVAINYTGAGGTCLTIKNNTRYSFKNIRIQNGATGSIGLALTSVVVGSNHGPALFENCLVTGFTTNVQIGDTSNRAASELLFVNCELDQATTGVLIQGPTSGTSFSTNIRFLALQASNNSTVLTVAGDNTGTQPKVSIWGFSFSDNTLEFDFQVPGVYRITDGYTEQSSDGQFITSGSGTATLNSAMVTKVSVENVTVNYTSSPSNFVNRFYQPGNYALRECTMSTGSIQVGGYDGGAGARKASLKIDGCTITSASSVVAYKASSNTIWNVRIEGSGTANIEAVNTLEDRHYILDTSGTELMIAKYGAWSASAGGDALAAALGTRVVATASLPSASSDMDGTVLIEDAGAGDRNLIVYAGAQRFRIDGGAAF